MADTIKITTPLTDDTIDKLKAGDTVLITGDVYTARDQAHKKLVDLLDKGEPLPFPVEGSLVYYVGPSPARPGKPIGSAGPTTSGRMNPYAPKVIAAGSKGMIGKGEMSAEVAEALRKHKAVYMVAVGGAAALIARSITAAEVVAYEDLGAEAISRLEVKDFPAIVAQDAYGNNLFVSGREEYEIK